MNFPVVLIRFIQSRRVGQGDGPISRADVVNLIADVMYLPEGKLAMQHPEDFSGDAKIINVVEIGGSAMVEATVSQWVLDSICTRKEIIQLLKVEGDNHTRYVWRGIKWIDERIASN